MSNNISHDCRYRLLSQNRNNQLEIEVVGENYRLLRSIHEVFSDEEFLVGFSQKDIDVISAIARDCVVKVVTIENIE